MAPGLDENRAPADKTADGLGVIDPSEHKLIDRWHVGSDPEQFAISKDGRLAFIANEDDASALIVDLSSGQSRGKVKVSEEPEGVGVNPQNGEVYVTCEEKGEVFAIDTCNSLLRSDDGPLVAVMGLEGMAAIAVRDAAATRLELDPGVLCSRERLEKMNARERESLAAVARVAQRNRADLLAGKSPRK